MQSAKFPDVSDSFTGTVHVLLLGPDSMLEASFLSGRAQSLGVLLAVHAALGGSFTSLSIVCPGYGRDLL